MMPGGLSEFRTDISIEEKNLFNNLVENLEGVDYTPLAVATQVVAGTNYVFFCNAKAVYPNAPNKAVLITIYVPLSGPAHIMHIENI